MLMPAGHFPELAPKAATISTMDAVDIITANRGQSFACPNQNLSGHNWSACMFSDPPPTSKRCQRHRWSALALEHDHLGSKAWQCPTILPDVALNLPRNSCSYVYIKTFLYMWYMHKLVCFRQAQNHDTWVSENGVDAQNIPAISMGQLVFDRWDQLPAPDPISNQTHIPTTATTTRPVT